MFGGKKYEVDMDSEWILSIRTLLDSIGPEIQT